MSRKYQAYTLRNLKSIPQIQELPQAVQFELQVVGQVYSSNINILVIIKRIINYNILKNKDYFRIILSIKNGKMVYKQYIPFSNQ